MNTSVALSVIALVMGLVGLLGAWCDPGGFLLGKRAHYSTISFGSVAVILALLNIFARPLI